MASTVSTGSAPLPSNHDVDDILMTTEHKSLLREHRLTLIENMYPEDLLHQLASDRVLMPNDINRIKHQGTIEEMNAAILDRVVRKPDYAFAKLVSALRHTDQNHVANLLQPRARRDSGRGDESSSSDRGLSSSTQNVPRSQPAQITPPRSKRKRKGVIGLSVETSEVEDDSEADLSELDDDDLFPKNKRRTRSVTAKRNEKLKEKINQEILETSLIEFRNLKEIARSGYSSQQLAARKGVQDTLSSLMKYRREILGIEEGSVIFYISCPTLEALEDLWMMYQNSYLHNLFEVTFVTKSLLRRFGLKRVKLKVTISRDDYLACWAHLLSPRTVQRLSSPYASLPVVPQATKCNYPTQRRKPLRLKNIKEPNSGLSTRSSSGYSSSMTMSPIDLENVDPIFTGMARS